MTEVAQGLRKIQQRAASPRGERRTEAGEIVISSFGQGKARPWVVLWIDDERNEACVVAVTTKSHFVATVATGHPRYARVGTWVTVQPLQIVNDMKRAGAAIDPANRRRVEAELAYNLGLRP